MGLQGYVTVLNFARSCHVVTVRVGIRAKRRPCFFFLPLALATMSTNRIPTSEMDLSGSTMYNAPSQSTSTMDGLQVSWDPAMSFPMLASGQTMTNPWLQSQSSPTTGFDGGLPTASSHNTGGEVVAGDAHPVGSLPDDDSRLAQALHRSIAQGKTYKQAIETLNGVSPSFQFVNVT